MWSAICSNKDKFLDNNREALERYAEKFEKNPKIQKFFKNDADGAFSLLEWLWKKSNPDVPLAGTTEISRPQVKKFIDFSENYLKNDFSTSKSKFANFFKLPKKVIGKFKEGDTLYKDIERAMDYNQHQTKQGALHVEKMMSGMFKMFETNNFSKADQKRFKKLEVDIARAVTPEARNTAVGNMNKFLLESSGDQTRAGHVLLKFRDLLEGSQLPKNEVEHQIVKEWDILRSSTSGDLMNAAITQKMIVDKYTRFSGADQQTIKRLMDKIQGRIESLMYQTQTDSNTIYKDSGGVLRVYNPKTKTREPYKIIDPITGKESTAIGVKKYRPDYVIELTNEMRAVTDFVTNKDSKKFDNMTVTEFVREIEKRIDLETLTNKLKSKGESDLYRSLDPAFYLSKYVNDIANANFRSRVASSFIDSMQSLHKLIGDPEKLDAYTKYKLDLINEIRDSAVNQNRGEIGELDRAVQIVNAYQYISKMGYAVRSGLKNRAWRIMNWAWFGGNTIRRSKEFYETTSRDNAKGKELNNEQMASRQLTRFGLKIGDAAAGAQLAASTAGSIDTILTFKGFELNSRGELVQSGNPTTTQKVASAIGKFASAQKLKEVLPEKTPKLIGEIPGPAAMMAWAENANRVETFKIAFSDAFIRNSRKDKFDYFKREIAEQKNTTPEAVSNKEVYDKIEYLSGNIAAQSVKTLHYDYNKWAKAKALQTPVGKVLGQYQHFKFAYFDMMYDMLKAAKTDIGVKEFTIKDPVTGDKIINPTISRIIRTSALQTILPLSAAGLFGVDLGGLPGLFGGSSSSLIENPVAADIKAISDYMTADPELGEEELRKKYDATYGKPLALHLLGGPALSDTVTFAQLFDFIDLVPEEYQELKNMSYDPDDPDWNYQVARTFSSAAARWGWHIIPAISNQNFEQAARILTGAYYPRYLKDWFGMDKPLVGGLSKIYGEIDMLPNIGRSGSGSQSKKRLREEALRDLSAFGLNRA